MSWQDIVFSAGTALFVVALIPSLKSKHKPHVSTSVINGVTVLVFAATYISLSLYYSAGMATVNAIMWLVLAYQKHKQNA